MDTITIIMTPLIVGAVLIVVAEFIGDYIDVIIYAIIGIAVVGGIGYGLYVHILYPAYLACRRFISEHPVLLAVIVAAAVVLLIVIRVLINICRWLTTDYNGSIYRCDWDIARATKDLARAKEAEENHRRCNEFEILEPSRHRHGYNPNRFEQEVDRCEDTLKRLKREKRYYEEQKRKADKWM